MNICNHHLHDDPGQLLDIDDSLVSDTNPARSDNPLDFERCARLHNYLVAYDFLESSRQNAEELSIDELLSRPSFFERYHYGSTRLENVLTRILFHSLDPLLYLMKSSSGSTML